VTTVPRFQEIATETLSENVFRLIGKEWMLITAGDQQAFNPMTASWGGMGFLWGRPVAFAFVRPQRHTFGLMERGAGFTLSFFGPEHREALTYCGTHSGRDVDKIAATGLTPLFASTGEVYFAQARLVLVCHKLYAQDLTEASFVQRAIVDEAYAAHDFHRMYVGGVVQVLARAEG